VVVVIQHNVTGVMKAKGNILEILIFLIGPLKLVRL
jgi:hypothetical protein